MDKDAVLQYSVVHYYKTDNKHPIFSPHIIIGCFSLALTLCFSLALVVVPVFFWEESLSNTSQFI